MKREIMLWRFGAGLLDGWAVIAILLVAIIGGYVCFGLAIGHRVSSVMELGAAVSGASFLGVVFSFTVLGNRLQSHPIMRLAPGAREVATALMRRLALVTLIALPQPWRYKRSHELTSRCVLTFRRFCMKCRWTPISAPRCISLMLPC